MKQISNVLQKSRWLENVPITFLPLVGSESVKLFVIAMSLRGNTLDSRTKELPLRDLETLLLLFTSATISTYAIEAKKSSSISWRDA